MVRLRNPVEGIIPKIHGTEINGSATDSNSFTAIKDKYIKAEGFSSKIISDVTTYLV